MEILLSSDYHLDHRGILKHTDRPWTEVEEMNEAIIAAHNSVVGRGDMVWLLGDIFWKGADTSRRLFGRLNGRKCLIRGNHDSASVGQLDWTEVADLKTFRHNGWSAVLCHYPILSWDGAYRGTVHLHGHSHGHLPSTTTRMDVGIDARGDDLYRPWALEEIQAIMADRTFDAPDGGKYNDR